MTRIPRLGIFATHPIQYQVPWFRAIQRSGAVELTVYYRTLPTAEKQGEGFGIPFEWDVPLLDGYRWEVIRRNVTATANVSIVAAVRACDVVIVTGWQHSFLRYAAIAARLTGRPVLVRGESNALRHRSFAIRFCHASFLRLFSGYLAIGEANDSFYQSYGIPETRRAWCRYFVDNDRFLAEANRLRDQRAALRQKWNVGQDAFCFLFAGKLIEKKHPFDVIEALRCAVSKQLPVHLLIAGDGLLRSTLETVAAAHALPVTFTGFLNQTEIATAYAAADALVLPSDYGETWGLVVNEAFLFGRPAIVSDRVGCGPDLVLSGETGLVVPFADVAALAGAMEQMVNAPAEARRWGCHGRDRVRQRYSIEAAVAGTLSAVLAASGARQTHSLSFTPDSHDA